MLLRARFVIVIKRRSNVFFRVRDVAARSVFFRVRVASVLKSEGRGCYSERVERVC